MGRKRMFDQETEAKIAEAYTGGKTLMELAAEYSVTSPTIRNVVNRIPGTSMRGRGRRKENRPVYEAVSLAEINLEDAGRFEKVFENFYKDNSRNQIVYADADRSLMVFTGMGEASGKKLKKWRATYRKAA